jgi:hypothetical protein
MRYVDIAQGAQLVVSFKEGNKVVVGKRAQRPGDAVMYKSAGQQSPGNDGEVGKDEVKLGKMR